jgi:hypothetical protein
MRMNQVTLNRIYPLYIYIYIYIYMHTGTQQPELVRSTGEEPFTVTPNPLPIVFSPIHFMIFSSQEVINYFW